MKHINPTTQARNRYFVEFAIAMVAFLAISWAANSILARSDIAGNLRTLIALAPVVPVLGLAGAVIRALRGCDERMQRIAVESLAIAGGVTALAAFAYMLLEGVGFPKPDAGWTYTVFMGSWLLTVPINWIMKRL